MPACVGSAQIAKFFFLFCFFFSILALSFALDLVLKPLKPILARFYLEMRHKGVCVCVCVCVRARVFGDMHWVTYSF